jgi:hypothetical protein
VCRAVQAYEEQHEHATLTGLLEHAAGLHAQVLDAATDRRITVSTIHRAKGTEASPKPALTRRPARWPRRARLGLRSETAWQRSPTAKSDGERRLRLTSPPRNATACVVSSSIRRSSRSIGCGAS